MAYSGVWKSRGFLKGRGGCGRLGLGSGLEAGAGAGARARSGLGGAGGNPGGEQSLSRSEKWALGVLAATLGTCGALFHSLAEPTDGTAVQGEIPSLPRYPWKFDRFLSSLDHSALRRGWQVYRTVCATCHSLRYVRFADLAGVTHTMEEVKRIAAEYEVEDGPDESGNRFERPARSSDLIPQPYPNEESARAANFGAYPPDLTYAVQAKKDGKNYVFSLLTGWIEAPAGVSLADGQHFNAYFPGGVTGMAQMLRDGMVDYEDGTPATESQMAKDVVEFLVWTSAQEHDVRKLMAFKGMGICTLLLLCLLRVNRQTWSYIRSRRIAYVPRVP